MTLKSFKTAQITIAIIIAIVIGQSIVFKNYYLPFAVIAVGTLVMLVLRRRVKDVIADERDYQIGGRSALLTLQIYSWAAVVVMLVFYSFRETDVVYGTVAATLAFSTCVLMLLYAVIFKRYIRKGK
jgi:uncharacterized membrane protein